MPSPVFDQLNLISDDLDATVRFYRQLGIRLGDPARTAAGEAFHASGPGGAGAQLEGDSSAFARVWNQGWQQEADLNGRIVVGLRVADRGEVDRLYGEVVDGAFGHGGDIAM